MMILLKIIIVFILSCSLYVNASVQSWNSSQCSDNNSTLCRGYENVVLRRKDTVEDKDNKFNGTKFWYDNLLKPSILVATSDALPEGICKRQLNRYIEELRNGTLWAVQMFDASAKYPFGIIDGHTRQLGSFDQCYGIDSYVPEHIQGRYCLVDYKYEQRNAVPNFSHNFDLEFDPNESAWEAIKEKGDYRRVRQYILQMAICVPASCSAKDVQKALQKPFSEFAEENNLIISINVDESKCQAKHEQPPVTTGTYVFCGTLIFIFTLVIIASLYDGTLNTEDEQNGTTISQKMLLCFSARRNYNTIFDVSYKHRGLDTIHMIRFFMMLSVILGHRQLQYYYNTTINMTYFEKIFEVPMGAILHNGTIMVDAFFAIGGLLTCYGLLDQFDKSNRMNFFGLTFIRFLRFTPAYALLVFFNAYLFPLLGSGPLWKDVIIQHGDNCAATWWSNLFYLNNYMTMDKMCIFQSWYLAVDFHCYLIGIFLIYAFWKYPRWIGYSLFGGLTFATILMPFCVTYLYRVQPFFIGFGYLTNIAKDPYFINYYVKTHLRMTPYFVGVIFGAILYDHQKAPWRISKKWSQFLFVLLVMIMGIYSQVLGFHFYNPNINPSSLETALYASLHRSAFAASCCFIILLITVGDGLDIHYNVLTPRWVQSFSRLTYSVFLSHNILQSYHVGTVRSTRTFSFHNAFWELIPDIFYSFLLALMITIGVEGPFRKLEKHFIMKREVLKIKTVNHTDSEPIDSKKID